jgi:hypothetical protein
MVERGYRLVFFSHLLEGKSLMVEDKSLFVMALCQLGGL